MTSYYKLTDADLRTYRGTCQWVPGEWQRAETLGPLCEEGGFHAYTSPRLAVLFNPIHGKYDPATMRLWRCEVDGEMATDQTKTKHLALRLVKEVELPAYTTLQRVYWAIRISLLLPHAKEYKRWAERWISGEDRSATAAQKAAGAWAAWAAAGAAVGAAWAKAEAAWAARAACAGIPAEQMDALAIEALVWDGARAVVKGE